MLEKFQNEYLKDENFMMLIELDNAFLRTLAALTRSLINPENKDIPLFEKEEANIIPSLYKLTEIVLNFYNLYTLSGSFRDATIDLFNEAFDLIAKIHPLQVTDIDAWEDLETYIGIMCDYYSI